MKNDNYYQRDKIGLEVALRVRKRLKNENKTQKTTLRADKDNSRL